METLVIFVKAPRPGLVKTRLAKAIGAPAAAVAYGRLVASLLLRLEPLPGVQLRFSPDDALPEIQPWLRPSWRAVPQGNGDLGRRLQSAFADSFAEGARRVVVIGSDCPEVSVEDIRDAWDQLATHDLVLGPAKDGGYWLIALRTLQPALFDGIAWSTDTVLGETFHRAQEARLSVHLLREVADIDTEQDWTGFLRRTEGTFPKQRTR